MKKQAIVRCLAGLILYDNVEALDDMDIGRRQSISAASPRGGCILKHYFP